MSKSRKKQKSKDPKEIYPSLFLKSSFPVNRDGKVVYIRPEYHERLIRIVQISRDKKSTLYSLIDNILEHHFKEYSEDIIQYYNERNKPII